MQFEPDELIGNKDHILSVFTEHLVNDSEDAEQGDDRRLPTQLKVFVTENKGYHIGNLRQVISNITERPNLHKNVEQYITNHKFKESIIEGDENLSYVEIETPELGQIDQFIFWNDGDYLKILTAERRERTKKTIERLIDYIPSLDSVLLSPSDLEDVIENLNGAFITGFTAKYYSFENDRSVSIQVYGGSGEDLEKVKRRFKARPTRIEFNQKNSPVDTVSSAVTQNGLFSVSSIQPGYEEKGAETIVYLFEALEDIDESNFKIDVYPEKIRVDTGTAVLGSTTVELSSDSDADGDSSSLQSDLADDDSSEENRFEALAGRVESEILEPKSRYAYSSWEIGKYEVFDKDNDQPFEITVDEESIRLHAKRGTGPDSYRDFCSYVYDLLNPTYTINNISADLKA